MTEGALVFDEEMESRDWLIDDWSGKQNSLCFLCYLGYKTSASSQIDSWTIHQLESRPIKQLSTDWSAVINHTWSIDRWRLTVVCPSIDKGRVRTANG